MRVISILNQKGGVGKTTTALNLGHALALAGCRVLMADLDPQAHLTASWGINSNNDTGIGDVLLGQTTVEESLINVRERLDIVPAGACLTEFEQTARDGAQQGQRLRLALLGLDYDFVLLDCPPSSSLLTMNALLAADQLLIPVSSDYLSLNGLARLMSVLKIIETGTHSIARKNILMTRYQKRRRLAQDVRERIEAHFGNQLLAVTVREEVAIAESPSFGQSIFEYRPNGHGAEDYRALGAAVLDQSPSVAA